MLGSYAAGRCKVDVGEPLGQRQGPRIIVEKGARAPPWRCVLSPRGQVWAMLIGWSKILQPWGGLWVWSTRLQRRPGEVRLHLCLRRVQCSSPQGQTRQKFDCATDRTPKHRTCAFAGSWCLCLVTRTTIQQSGSWVPCGSRGRG